ncbi:NADH-quinone oxidoreductase subunit NuoE family protein [Actinomarinicola tropica]|uniref:NADH-quinone oxidoreductase subunit NuoE n=1 Tax=Actinomarinicola tropica TaxID=2789776 RepID=A0A5Q2RKT8_9ACTN|nr:NAD(P)H-dependent oxidoreductase subunit E [Actinomarinicola tropica]QGG93805.1 NADH-quinone oxidoreductase subunit NuoE [Actinomarinicola tropica]
MARLNEANLALAREIIARYPRKKSALIPLLHLAQEQDGYVTEDAMEHLAELVGVTPAQVLGTASFYEMFKFHPVGRYVVNICGTMSCALLGADELIERAEERLGVRVGGTTEDGAITLERAECQAACTEAPCLQVNYRHQYRVTPDELDTLLDDLRSGSLTDDIPDHGTLGRVRQRIPADRWVQPVAPEAVTGAPAWMPAPDTETDEASR